MGAEIAPGALDMTSAASAPPPRQPLQPDALAPAALVALGDAIVAATWRLGLPNLFWGEGICLLGMVRLEAVARGRFPPTVHDWLVQRASAPIVIDHVNNVAPAAAAVLDGTPETRPIVDAALSWMRAGTGITRAPNGAIEHWPGGVWADTVCMAGIPLALAGERAGDRALVDELGLQLEHHAALLQHPLTALAAHGQHRGETIPCYWGRANAWIALASVEYLELCARRPELADMRLVERVSTRLRTQLETLARLQPAHGVWSVLVDDQPENRGILETSAAAGIAAAMLRAARVVPGLPPEVVAAGRLAAAAALAYVDDGVLTRVSAGTVLQLVPFGYSVIRDDRPQLWGQGLALHAIAALLAADAGAS